MPVSYKGNLCCTNITQSDWKEVLLKQNTPILIITAIIFSLVLSGSGLAKTVGVDATRLKQLSTDKSPLDVEATPDGKLMFILVPGEVLIFTNLGDRPVNRIAVGEQFNRMTFVEKLDMLVLSSETGKKVEMVRVDLINEISIEGSPYLGRADALVTIAVFDDYQ